MKSVGLHEDLRQKLRRVTVNHPFTLGRPLLALMLPLGFLASSAGGVSIPVVDGLNLNQNIVTAVNNAQQVLQ